MSFEASGPGKTAPRIHHDFLAFDPSKTRSSVNILASHPPPLEDGEPFLPHRSSCKHNYTTKASQSVAPPLDLRPDGKTKYKLAVVCKRCRLHADIKLDYDLSTNPCPNSEFPLHHFQRLRANDIFIDGRIRYAWQCSSGTCRAVLFIDYRQHKVTSQHIQLLTNAELLRRRYETVLKEDPTREGIRQATPMEALSRLRKYIKDSLNTAHTKRTFPANNKRFMEAFGAYGEDCKDMLQGLGFTYADFSWTLPDPPPIENRLAANGSNHREYLEDVEMELLAWMCEFASQSQAMNPAAEEGWPSAHRELERMLAAQGYQRNGSLRRPNTSSEQEHYFASLGARLDFADSLVDFAYERQATCDPEQQTYYFECLRTIAASRASDELQLKVTMLASQGIVSRRDLNEAYRFFDLPNGGGGADDDRILNLFQAQQPDLSPFQQERARDILNRLGVARNSDALIAASRQTIDTYEQALTWLGNGATKDTSDDMITTLFALRTDNNATNEEIGRKAVSVIAKARKSDTLNNWLSTGRTDGYTMSVDEALRHLGVEQSLHDVEPTMWPTIFDNAKLDRPGDTTEKAVAAVQQALRGKGSTAPHAPESWPVGLTSHGNTCYLNSLLQYYFSIKPLREIVLDYDSYKLDTSTHAEKLERVGQRIISPVEIKGGQKFAEELKHLFDRMIKEPGSAVRPEQDLVCRAFLDPKDSDLWRPTGKAEESAITESPVEERKANGLKVSEDGNEVNGDSTTNPMAEEHAEIRHESDASSATLQASVNGDSTDAQVKNGELPPTPPASPGQKPADVKMQPDHAPPLPPRRFSTTTSAALLKAQENARLQQDVTEVHDGIMFRLRAGMKPVGKDASEEQLDPLRDLFSIGMTNTVLKDGVPLQPKALADSSIQLNVPTEDTDIYSALDAVFDLQPVVENTAAEQYKSIQSLPPILQISMPRIGFDTLRGGTYKADATIKLEDELCMDRYCDSGDAGLIDRRRSSWGWRKRLQALKQEQKALKETAIDIDGPAAVAESASYLNHLGDVNSELRDLGIEPIDLDAGLPSTLTSDSRTQAQKLEHLSAEISNLQSKLSALFADLKTFKYRLHAVFIHRGNTASGHYWTYIHDFHNKMWRKYNDETVEEFTQLKDIFEARGYAPGTPTYAVYVRDDLKEQYVQAVCRAPEQVVETQNEGWESSGDGWNAPDVQMLDNESRGQKQERQRQRQQQGVDPKMVMEGGQGWDAEREVAADPDW